MNNKELHFEIKISELIYNIKTVTNINDFIFTKKLFNEIGGYYLISNSSKLVIRLLKNSKGFNFKLIKECSTRNYKIIEFSLNASVEQLAYQIQNIRLTTLEFANKLNENLPKSEIWFKNKFTKESIYNSLSVSYNKVIKKYIYDVYIPEIKLLIEVDGSYHDREDQKLKDKKKDEYAINRDLLCVRVKAYDEDSYNACISEIIKRIQLYKKEVKKPKTILRKAITV